MRIMWWNTYRLGLNTEQARRVGIENSRKQWGTLPEVVIFCELTPTGTNPLPLSFNFRRPTGKQLCYGVANGDGTLPAPEAKRFEPGPATDCYKDAGYKGGNTFSNLINRAPGKIDVGGVPVYFLHAPAYASKAVKPLNYLACDLSARHGTDPWVLVGDFNIEPDQLRRRLSPANLADLIKEPDRATHRRGRKLDYALSNMDTLVVTVGARHGLSDHNPILVADQRGVKRARPDS